MRSIGMSYRHKAGDSYRLHHSGLSRVHIYLEILNLFSTPLSLQKSIMIKRRTRNQLQRSSRQVVAASTVPGEANKLLGEEIIKGDNKSCTSDITNTESNSLRTDDQSTCEHCSTRSSPIWRRGMHGELLCNACGLYWKHNGIYRPLMAALNRKSKQALESVVHNPGTETRKAPDRDAKRRLRSSAVPLPEPSIVKVFEGFTY